VAERNLLSGGVTGTRLLRSLCKSKVIAPRGVTFPLFGRSMIGRPWIGAMDEERAILLRLNPGREKPRRLRFSRRVFEIILVADSRGGVRRDVRHRATVLGHNRSVWRDVGFVVHKVACVSVCRRPLQWPEPVPRSSRKPPASTRPFWTRISVSPPSALAEADWSALIRFGGVWIRYRTGEPATRDPAALLEPRRGKDDQP